MTKSQVRFSKDLSSLSVPRSDTVSSVIRQIGEKTRTLCPLSLAICYLFDKLRHNVSHQLASKKKGRVLLFKTIFCFKNVSCRLLQRTTNNLGQNKWKTLTPPPPQIKDGKMARFCPSRGFILDLGGMGVCCSILFCPRLEMDMD